METDSRERKKRAKNFNFYIHLETIDLIRPGKRKKQTNMSKTCLLTV